MDELIIIADCSETFKTIDGREVCGKKNEKNKKAAVAVIQNKYKFTTQRNSRIWGRATIKLITGKVIIRVEKIKLRIEMSIE